MKGEMGKMKITYHEIVSELENLGRELERHGNEALSHKDKITVSDLLAETVQMIRRKYELTTMYYLTSEYKAVDGIGPAGKHECREAEWGADFNDPGWFVCSGCGGRCLEKENFCPDCGRRMVQNDD